MKNLKKLFAVCLALVMLLSCVPAAFAAEVDDATIDMDAECSLTIWKYDFTNARKDGVWDDDSFISTGWREPYVEEVLGEAVRVGDANGEIDNPLGNGQNSNGYAQKGIAFTILRVADFVTYSEPANDEHPECELIELLYGFDSVEAADLLAAIGLADGAGRAEYADSLNNQLVPMSEEAAAIESTIYYYTSDTLNKALYDSLSANATAVKDALEAYVKANPNAIVMEKTNENGKTMERGLQTGLYICVETSVSESVLTTNPFFVSLPMTSVSGDSNSASPEGGHVWNYNVVVYPKDEVSIPELTKEVRESASQSTGKNNGTDEITDGFDHIATGSSGDVMEYQILSTLGAITSDATKYTHLSYYDTICGGIDYNKNLKDVKIEVYSDKDCTDKVATWLQDDGRFTITYSSDDRHMTIDITEAGLAEINGDSANVNGHLYKGYSNYTLRITYTATINSDDSFIYGEAGNDNEVVMTWKRTSTEYYDTLIDDCHVFSFGLDLTKIFSDIDSESATEMDMFKHVKFRIRNVSDGYWLTAARDEETGIYYVTGHVTEEADSTIFYPVTSGGEFGKIVIKGCEEDSYEIFEIETANGYIKLKDSVMVDIWVEEDALHPCDIYSKDILGVLQNDPHYNFDGGHDLSLSNIPQTQLAHNYLLSYAAVNGKDTDMLTDGESEGALAYVQPIKNDKGFDLPQTGDNGVWMYGAIGITMMAGALVVILLASKKSKKNQSAR